MIEARSARQRRRTAPAAPAAGARQSAQPDWTFLTNHAHVLLCIARGPEARMRDIAAQVGITERAVQRIVSELEGAGYIERTRDGRRNHYEVRTDLSLRHPIERHRSVSSLLELVLGAEQAASSAELARQRPVKATRRT